MTSIDNDRIKKIRTGLRCCKSNSECMPECPYDTGDPWCADKVLAEADELIGELLREQEPVRPETDSYPFSGFIRFRCGNCGLDIGFGGHKYCWWCGRAVKWDV